MVSLVTLVVNIVVPHAFWVFALYTWLAYYNLHISLLLTSNYNACQIHSFILVCGCSLKKKQNLIRGAFGSTWGHNFLWAHRMDQNEKFDGRDF